MEAVRGFPQVFEHVDDVAQDRYRPAVAPDCGFDQRELLVVAVHDYDPRSLEVRVETSCVFKSIVDHILRFLLDACPHPLVCRPRSPLAHLLDRTKLSKHVFFVTNEGLDGVDDCHLRHSLSVRLLSFRQAFS